MSVSLLTESSKQFVDFFTQVGDRLLIIGTTPDNLTVHIASMMIMLMDLSESQWIDTYRVHFNVITLISR